MADVTRRMLDLLTLLQTKRRFTGAELVTRLGVSERTVRRDIDRLREYGYPVDAAPGPGGHYGLSAGRALPPLMFDDDEAVATMLALAAHADADSGDPGSIGDAMARAYGKFDQVLPPRLARSVARVRESVEARAFRVPTIDLADITDIAVAIDDHRELEFDYRRGDAATHRRVEPHRQVHHLLRWYLVAWDLDKADWRIFRTDRMAQVNVRTALFEPRHMPEDEALDLLRKAVARSSRTVVVSVDATVDDVVGWLSFESMAVEAVGDRRTRVTLECEDWHWLLLIVSRLESGFTIEEPKEWADAIRHFATALA